MIIIEAFRGKRAPCLQYEAHLPIAGSRPARAPLASRVARASRPWTRAKHMGETPICVNLIVRMAAGLVVPPYRQFAPRW